MAPTLRSIEAKISGGEPVGPEEVRWLAESLRALVGPDPDPGDEPTPEELAAEFGLGSSPSPDMLEYLREFVRDRRAQEAADASE
ncbi:hypothetical protein [Sanguibacter inulinus]|uniref:Uncharacterized protein n=1 Tax=Sanguibacter inulinus TaxID=60922 RepID=A0A853EUD9_9MICO|nr:hypothetical protein [Sanguibacter inulinus]MBF0722966.1 hypothetical protein [Sanguibacter inulinus]NYS94111.1 hypothetical protein [Sanguibacter inulinus]